MSPDDDAFSTLDRSASRMSRKSLGPPRPPPPRSRPSSRLEYSSGNKLSNGIQEPPDLSSWRLQQYHLSRQTVRGSITQNSDSRNGTLDSRRGPQGPIMETDLAQLGGTQSRISERPDDEAEVNESHR